MVLSRLNDLIHVKVIDRKKYNFFITNFISITIVCYTLYWSLVIQSYINLILFIDSFVKRK